MIFWGGNGTGDLLGMIRMQGTSEPSVWEKEKKRQLYSLLSSVGSGNFLTLNVWRTFKCTLSDESNQGMFDTIQVFQPRFDTIKKSLWDKALRVSACEFIAIFWHESKGNRSKMTRLVFNELWHVGSVLILRWSEGCGCLESGSEFRSSILVRHVKWWSLG